MIYSKYQENVFDFVENGTGNGAVIAVAGAAKTTTAVESVKKISGAYDVLFTSFGKAIADELKKKINKSNVNCSTYNAFGWGICLQQMTTRPELDANKTENILKYGIFGNLKSDEDKKRYYKSKNTIKRLVSLLKGRNIHDVDNAYSEYPNIMEHHGIDSIHEDWFERILLDTFNQSISNTSKFDFDDQKFMPIHLDLNIPSYDIIMVDEAQDTNPLENILMERACLGGRHIIIGDPMQSIYGFRDADPETMNQFIKQKNAKNLPLSICYRCSKAAVREAQKIVPHIEPFEENCEGAVDMISAAESAACIEEGDFVLGRTTEVVVRYCLARIREGRKAYVRGKDIGQDLIQFIDSIEGSNDYLRVESFYDLMNAYVNQKIANLSRFKKENQIARLEEQQMTIEVLVEDVDYVYNLKKKIETIFTDVGDGIQCMTIHKSKGLQAPKNNNVHLLRRDLIPHPRCKKEWQVFEEQRLLYVAITRTQKDLYYVKKAPGEK